MWHVPAPSSPGQLHNCTGTRFCGSCTHVTCIALPSLCWGNQPINMKECVEVTGALSWPLCWEIKVWIDSANCNEGWFCDILPCFAPRHLKLGLKQRAHGNNLSCYLTFGNFKILTSWNPKPNVSVYLSLNVLLQMIKLKPKAGSQK